MALDVYRDEIRRIVTANRASNPRVFGSVVQRADTETSDLDLLVDAAAGFSLFDMAAIIVAIETLTHAKVDVRTLEDFSPRVRRKVLEEAMPV